MSTEASIPALLAELAALPGSHSDQEFGASRAGAAEEEIHRLEETLGALPEDFKTFYRHSDGWFNIDGRWTDLSPIQGLIEDADADESGSLMLGFSGQNDIAIYMFLATATGAECQFVVEDWDWDGVADTPSDPSAFAGWTAEAQEEVEELIADAEDDGKRISSPLYFTAVLRHLLERNAGEW